MIDDHNSCEWVNVSVPAHPSCLGQNPESHNAVVVINSISVEMWPGGLVMWLSQQARNQYRSAASSTNGLSLTQDVDNSCVSQG